MTPTRTLSLKREALQELTPDDLAGVAGGATRTVCDTLFSCLTYESCWCVPTVKPACA